jgi:hypothetical protein
VLRPAIVTIPITPRQMPKLGLMLIPFIMDVLSKKMGIDKVLALNIGGMKLRGNTEAHVRGYLQANSALGIDPDHVWRDDQNENTYWVNTFFQQLMSDGYIIKDEQLLLRCPCRAVETLASAENSSNTRKLYERTDDSLRCKVCNGAVISETDVVYLFQVPQVPVNWQIAPDFTRKEIVNLAKRFVGLRLLISRTRSSAVPLWTGKEYIFLNVDFCWQLFLPTVRRFGYQPIVFVGSQKNLFGCYISILLSYLIDKVIPELIVPGYCITKTEADKVMLDSFPNWNKSITRTFLAGHCTFRKKELVFTPSILRLIECVTDQLKVEILRSKSLSLPEAMSECEAFIIRDLLATGKHEREINVLLKELL